MSRARVVAPVLTAVLAGALTGVVVFSPLLRFAYRNPQIHLATETAATLVAGFAAFLVVGRIRADGRRADVLLATALVVLATTNLAFALVPALTGAGAPAWADWSALVGRLLGNVFFAAAAFAPPSVVRQPVVALRRAVVAAGTALALAAAAFAAAAGALPPTVALGASPEASVNPLLAGHPVVLVVQVGSALLLALAAVGYTAAPAWRRSSLGTCLAVAAVFGAAARVNYALFPSVYSEWVYTGDAFRLAFYAALLLAVVREIRDYWRRLAEVAVLEERRRIARDLHDGLAQDLAYVVRHAPELSVAEVRAAAARALDESRQAISALTRPTDEPLDTALAVAAEEVARRAGGRVRLDLAHGVAADGDAREALVKVAREAVGNALRHSGAQAVTLRLEAEPLRLIVRDDGRGFDPERVRDGFGITSMRERVERLGGTLSIRSAPDGGTAVEAVLA